MPHGMRVENLHAWFGDVHALKGVDLELPAGAVTAVMGPSGCGKSTLIRCLNRLHETRPNTRVQGRVLLGDRDIYEPRRDPAEVRRRIGLVFPEPNPFPNLSIFDNVAAGLKLNGVRDNVRLAERVEACLVAVGLWGEVNARLRASALSLSTGQRQRLCIARALALEPEALLMDEPTYALGPIATARVEDLLQALGKTYTVVVATHDLQQAARVSDHTAFLLDGELVECGPTGRLFTAPQDERTESYLTGRFG
ncbi:MAG TPA: phosphate ABC transporter ATP-binding protein [Limnochordia bacterium]|nr:phosphate ABC transporter ATP-binding protein [Limnochordia bacterium]